MKGSIDIFTSAEREAWLKVVRGSVAHDFYLLPFYHDLAHELGEGDPRLFVFTSGETRIILPLLLRRIDEAWCPPGGQPWYDATSVYGYAGPLASCPQLPAEVIRDFQEALWTALSDMRVVSVFSRLHPFIEQKCVLTGLGKLVFQGKTVSIDLSIPEEEQRALYRENHRRDIRKLLARGAVCTVDHAFRHLDTFIAQYHETMARVNAMEHYKFPDSYFRKFASTQEACVKLVVCSCKGEVVSSGLFVKVNGIMEYHLGAMSEAAQKTGAMKLVLDTARHWGFESGAKTFHLGGGVGSCNDSLASFKEGFSPRLHSFYTWRWVIQQDVYNEIVKTRSAALSHEKLLLEPHFFPAYRAPTIHEERSIEMEPAENVSPGNSRSGGQKDMLQPGPQSSRKLKRLVIFGAGGHARVIADAVLSRRANGGIYELVGFLDDNPTLCRGLMLGKPVLGSFSELDRIPHDAVVVGVGDNETRRRLYEHLKRRGETLATVIHPHALIAHDVRIGRGTVAFAGVIVNTGTTIGENVILNSGCSVDHDCSVKNHAHICPGAHLGGTITVGEGAFVGINSTIIHGRTIGDWSTVGGGTVIIRDVEPRTTVVGVPGRTLAARPTAQKPDTRDLFFLDVE